MEVKQLYTLIQKLSLLSSRNSFITSINQIKTSLTQYKTIKALAAPTVAQQQQIGTLITTVENTISLSIKALSEIQLELNDYKLVKTFSQLKVDNPYGPKAMMMLERVRTEMDSNIDSLITELTQYIQKLNSYQQFINSLNVVLGDVEEKFEEDKDELIIFFEGGATVENLKELSKVSADWNKIVNCFSRLTKENNTDIYIVSIERGSLIATLSISAAIIGGIIRCSDKVLDLILKVYEVRKKALELKNMKLDGISKAIEILEKQSTLNLSNEAKLIAKELMKEYGWEEGAELFHETENATAKGVKQIIKFQNQGGKVDSRILNPSKEENEIVVGLKEKNIQFLKVEEEVKNLVEGKQILQIEEGENPDDDDQLND